MLTYGTLVDAYSQGLQGIDKALLVCHGPVAEAADVVLVQRKHGKAFADTSCQLQQARKVNLLCGSTPLLHCLNMGTQTHCAAVATSSAPATALDQSLQS